MECREAERLVGKFIDDEMDSVELSDFLEHVEHCGSCMEELSIQFLVEEGMHRLEEGNTFDLQNELLSRLDAARKQVMRRKTVFKALYYGEMAAIILILILTIVVIIL
ncbi:MAG: zf-HC2 domain-containing protein [Clostridiales bacterium]|nr:zf-HC2 domain-containing protein [Clostridiales bacterium]